jgi:hypothetical protein
VKALAGLAVLAWLCALALAGLAWRCFTGGLAMLPVEAVAASGVAMAACAVSAVVVGAWRSILGPGRIAALVWSVVAITPCAIVAADVYHARRLWEKRLAPRTYAFVAAQCLVAAAIRVGAQRAYRYKLDTNHLRMHYQPDLPRPRRDAERMSAFVAKLASRLTVQTESRLIWLRGGMLGLSRLGFGGIAIGSSGPDDDDDDRHAVAAAMLDGALGRADPPALLTDGWAFAEATASTKHTARAAISARNALRGARLADLTAGDSYHRHSNEIAALGGGFVLFLRERFDEGTVLELCRQSTVNDWPRTFQQVTGASLATLDARFAKWLREKAGRASP